MGAAELGARDGVVVGKTVGTIDGTAVGFGDGIWDGVPLGVFVGTFVGPTVGPRDGATVGAVDGTLVGSTVGISDGATVGGAIGMLVGPAMGMRDGECVGIDDSGLPVGSGEEGAILSQQSSTSHRPQLVPTVPLNLWQKPSLVRWTKPVQRVSKAHSTAQFARVSVPAIMSPSGCRWMFWRYPTGHTRTGGPSPPPEPESASPDP